MPARHHAVRLTSAFVMIGLLCCCLTAPTGAAPARPVSGDAAAGREKSDSERCQECHGPRGEPVATEGILAKLAGQYPQYIVKQIEDFRAGRRKHDFMAIMARSLADEDLVDIAAYFAAQPRMSGQRRAPGSPQVEAAKALYLQGDARRGIAACASCHGEQGQGAATKDMLSPVIGGQDLRYLDKQLRDWRSGERRNSAQGVMTQAARALTDHEIEGLASYLSSLH